MPQDDAWVLEILRQENVLAMSLFARSNLSETLRHYSRSPVSYSQIERLCQEVNSVLNKAGRRSLRQPELAESLQKSGQLLWDELLSPAVKEKLKPLSNRELLLCLDEELNCIPWELLYDGEEFFCLKFNLGRVVKTQEKDTCRNYRNACGPLRMLVLANPTNDLNSAYREGLCIKNQFDHKRNYLNIDFKSSSIDTIYLKKNLCDYDIVHFAGHCEYDASDPQKSGWVLSDARLVAQDILKLGQTLAMPQLVFSNACQCVDMKRGLLTDSLCQQRAHTFASAFLFSGVRHYIGAAWKIEDPPSLVFAREFYAQLVRAKPLGECVRLARLKLLSEYGIASMHWAGYVFYGDPAASFFAKPAQPAMRARLARLGRKWAGAFAAAMFLFLVCLLLYFWLPSLKPATYAAFIKSEQLFLKGKNQEALLWSERIAASDPLFLPVYPLLADIYHRLGDGERALKYYFDYALGSQKRNDRKGLASAYTGIGWLYYQYGDYPRAREFYEKALVLSREAADKLNEASVLRRMAVWHMDKQENDLALELLTKSSEINRDRQYSYKHRYNLACDYFDMGLLFTNKNDFTTARGFYIKSKALFEKMHLKNELSDCYFNLGELYLYDKQYQKALDCYLEGLEIDRRHENLPALAADYNMLGELYAQIGKPDDAERFFQDALELSRKIDSSVELAAAYYNLGLLYKDRGSKGRAGEYFRLAQEIYGSMQRPEYEEIKKKLLESSGSGA